MAKCGRQDNQNIRKNGRGWCFAQLIFNRPPTFRKKKLDEQFKKAISVVPAQVKSTNSVRTFNGLKAIKGMWDKINNSLNKQSNVKIYATTFDSYQNFIGFYDEHHKIQCERNVPEKMIFDSNDPEAKRRKNELTQIRTTDLKNKCEWGIMDDYAFFQYIVSKEPKSILIQDKIIIETLNQVFDKIWDSIEE